MPCFFTCFNEVQVLFKDYRPHARVWSEVQDLGTGPGPRFVCGMNLQGGSFRCECLIKLIFFGGCKRNENKLYKNRPMWSGVGEPKTWLGTGRVCVHRLCLIKINVHH